MLGVSKDPFLLVMVEDEQLKNYLQRAAFQIDAEPMFYGWILAESYVRKWLRSEWALVDLDLSEDNSFLSIKSDLDHTFENSKKFRRGLNYVSDRPNRDEELDSNHPKNYFLSRILDFTICDGIVLVVKRDLENQPGFAIPYKLKIGQASAPQIYDRKNQRLTSEDWVSAFSEFTKKNSEPLNLHLLASFEKGGEELVGTSFLLSLKIAMWRIEKKVSLHPLEFGVTGGLNEQSGEIEMVRSLLSKSECAHNYGAFLFVAPSPRPEPKDQFSEEEPMAWINVQNKSLEESLETILYHESQMWMKRARDLEFSAGNEHSAVTFKLVYELDFPRDWEGGSISGFRLIEEGERGLYFSKLRINELHEKFSANLFYRADDFGKSIPCAYEMEIDLLQSLDTLRKNKRNPLSKWAKLTRVDLIPYKGKNGVRSAKLGFIFKSIKGHSVSFKDYQKFITERQFGKILLHRQKMIKENEITPVERDESSSISISQIILEIKKILFTSKEFNFEDLSQAKSNSEDQPEIHQLLLSPQEKAEGDKFWQEMCTRPDFQKAFDLISSFSVQCLDEPKIKSQNFVMAEALDTLHAIHHRGITFWAHSGKPFNKEKKPHLVTKSFCFISLLAHLVHKEELDARQCEKVFEDNVQTRITFFRECLNFRNGL